ncbi:hypothetical protein [Mycobacterium sp. AT1]|uniref:hypothetical protein n=1 Tax=Mycobacterium sp. AT1 TaxID=1961706 RepID=UPI0009C7B9CC|nr:hypothetical protein [Mycobacterium sp. AT1]OPX12000.1 hypothetical protein B1790_06050 [Mycobacterium sp. AT1]
MSDHSSRRPADDAAEEALVHRVAEAQAARLGHPVPVDLDPLEVRLRVGIRRDALTVALWALRRDGGGVPDAIDTAAERCTDCGICNLPVDVALAILHRTPGTDTRADLRTELGAVLADWKSRDDRMTRPRIELTVWRLTETTRGVLDRDRTGIGITDLIDAIADELTIYAGMS